MLSNCVVHASKTSVDKKIQALNSRLRTSLSSVTLLAYLGLTLGLGLMVLWYLMSSDGRLKFIQDRIGKVELQFGDICRATSAYVRHIAKLRDKGRHRRTDTFGSVTGSNPMQ